MPKNERMRSLLTFLYNIVRKDFSRKLIALVLTAIIYVAVLDRLSVSHDIPGIDIPINPPSGFVVMQAGTPSVRLTVTGSQSRLKRLKPEDFRITDIEIKPEKYVEGKPYVLQLSPSNFHAPLGVTVVSVSPESLRIDIDKLETLRLPVKASFDPNHPLPTGYKVEECSFNPSEVFVTAPSMFLRGKNAIKEVITYPIGLSNMTGSFDIDQKILSPRPGIKISPETVSGRVHIIRKFGEKTYKDLKIRIMQNPGQTAKLAEISHAAVKLSASSEILNELISDDIHVYVFAGDLPPNGSGMLKLNCTVNGKDVTILSITPERVKVISQ